MSRRVMACQSNPVTFVPSTSTGGPVEPALTTSFTGSCSVGSLALRRPGPACWMASRVRIGTWRQSAAVMRGRPATGTYPGESR